MGGVPIKIVDEIKLLGLTVDKKLTFNNHVSNVCRKATNIYKQLARIAKIEWGLNPEVVRVIYVAVIEPIIMYASSVWAEAAGKIMIQKQLNTVQRGFAQKICKSYRTVSLNAALVLAGLLPLDLRIREAAQLYEAKRGQPITGEGDLQIEQRISYLQAPHPAEEVAVTFQCLEDMLPKTIEEHHIPDIHIYTDGSKIEGKVGAAYTCWKNGKETRTKRLKLGSFCTVFQAELFALYEATVLLQRETHSQVAVLSDSRSALELIQNPDTFHPLAFQIRRNIKSLMEKGCTIRWFWIKAHVGTPGNERADELAKQAALNTKVAAHYDRCPASYFKKVIRQRTVDVWGHRYKHAETAKTTKYFLPNVSEAYRVVRNLNLTPILTQVLTGHGGFAAYLHRFKCKESPSCVCDDEKDETIQHLLLECPKYDALRCDLEIATNTKLTPTTLSVMLSEKPIIPHFKAFCTKVAQDAVRRNKTR